MPSDNPKARVRAKLIETLTPKVTQIMWRDIIDHVKLLAEEVTASRVVPSLIVGIGRGGMIPATMLAHRLAVARVGCLEILSYQGRERKLVELKSNQETLDHYDNPRTLFIDELWDSGETMKQVIRNTHRKPQFAVLYHKDSEARELIQYPGKPVPGSVWLRFPWEVTDNG